MTGQSERGRALQFELNIAGRKAGGCIRSAAANCVHRRAVVPVLLVLVIFTAECQSRIIGAESEGKTLVGPDPDSFQVAAQGAPGGDLFLINV